MVAAAGGKPDFPGHSTGSGIDGRDSAGAAGNHRGFIVTETGFQCLV